MAGFASFQGTYRSRAGVVVATCVTMSLSVFVGATVGHVLGIDIVVVGLSGFVAGMLVSPRSVGGHRRGAVGRCCSWSTRSSS